MSRKTLCLLFLLHEFAFVWALSSGPPGLANSSGPPGLRGRDRVDCDGNIEDFYYATKIEYSTTKECNENQLLDIRDSVISSVNIVAGQVIEAISKEADFIATDGSANNDFCPDIVISEKQDSGGRALRKSRSLERRLTEVSLELDLLGGGHWRLCYPAGMFEPDSDRFDAQILLDMASLETEILSKKRAQKQALAGYNARKIEETIRLECDRALLEGAIEKEVIDMEVEAEDLNVTHASEWLALMVKYDMNIPQTKTKKLSTRQANELLGLQERHRKIRERHEGWMEDLQFLENSALQDLAEEKRALETSHLSETRLWDRERAILQAKLAHQRYLENMENREQKRSETVNEDLASIQFSYERALEEYVSESLWRRFQKPKQPSRNSPCFLEKPQVNLSIKRVLTAAEANPDPRMCLPSN